MGILEESLRNNTLNKVEYPVNSDSKGRSQVVGMYTDILWVFVIDTQ